MSSRKAGSRPTKRRRTDALPAFGAPSAADSLSAQTNVPSSSAFSTRRIVAAYDATPSLVFLSMRVFATNFRRLAGDDSLLQPMLHALKLVPEPLVPKLFALLRETCPTFLSNALIKANFMRGPSLTLSDGLPGVNSHTILDISSMGIGLRELELSNLQNITDNNLASVIPTLTSLRKLVLRGCIKVGTKTTYAIAKSCPSLIVLNLNYTSVTPVSLVPIILQCRHLEVLKLAGIANWTDATFAKLLAGIRRDLGFKLNNLRSLKFKQTALSDTSLDPFIALAANLRRLDISFTDIRHPPAQLVSSDAPPLEKLSLMSTKISSKELVDLVVHHPRLKTLALGALGGVGRPGGAQMIRNTAMTLDDDTLDTLTEALQHCPDLENINLAGNTRIGTRRVDSALTRFIHSVGRRCKILNLGGLPSLHSDHLVGLLGSAPSDGELPLEELTLNMTNVDDQASPYISSCARLRSLRIAGTKFTAAGLFPVLDACTRLEELELTSCRGINIHERRRFFEVWEKEWRDRG